VRQEAAVQIYMTFLGADVVVRRGPSLTWLRTSMALDLMELAPDLRAGKVTLDRLKEGLDRARGALLNPEGPGHVMVRSAADKAALVAALDLIDQVRLEALGRGATEFAWREDF
jgi:hypothetical protein